MYSLVGCCDARRSEPSRSGLQATPAAVKRACASALVSAILAVVCLTTFRYVSVAAGGGFTWCQHGNLEQAHGCA